MDDPCWKANVTILVQDFFAIHLTFHNFNCAKFVAVLHFYDFNKDGLHQINFYN